MIREISWDSEFFGRKIGRLERVGSVEELESWLGEARREGFSYLTCRLDAGDIRTVQILEKGGFYLTDIGIIWGCEPGELAEPAFSVREGRPQDDHIVSRIADGLFRGGRFYRDPFFSEEEADRLYRTWAVNSLRGFADALLMIEDKGFIACRIGEGGRGDISLFGVAAGCQRQGIGAALVLGAIRWFRSKGISFITVRTQASNSRASRLYERHGFRLHEVDIVMARIL